MDTDFCQQEVKVTTVTSQRSDVILSNRCFAWKWDFLGGENECLHPQQFVTY